MKLNWSYYQCTNPECKGVFDHYRRYCPNCDAEKSIEFVEDGLMKNFLVNLLTTTDFEKLKEVALLTASMGLPTQTQEGLKAILEDSLDFINRS